MGQAFQPVAPLAGAEEALPVADSAPGERRHLTVLFCDLVGSTEIAARLDPEEWRELVASYHRAAADAITRYGGHVAKYLGDGVMAYFGWPEAHDNDAERAARAGLAILEALAKLNEPPARLKLKLPAWTIEDLDNIEAQKFEYYKTFQGHMMRHFNNVQEGEELPVRPIGPHTIQTLSTE